MAKDEIVPKPAPPDVVTTTILVDDKEVPGTINPISIIVTKEVNRIPSAKIVFPDGESALQTFKISNTDQFIPGRKIEIKAGYKAKEDTIFKGIIISHNIKVRSYGSYLTVECRDETIRMTYDRKCQYHAGQKDNEIAEALFDKYKIGKNVQATSPEHKDMVQFDSTDWDYIITRCEANGMFCTPDDGHVKIAAPDFTQAPVLAVSFGSSIIELDVEMDSRLQFKSATSQAWNPADQKMIKADAIEPKTNTAGNISAEDLAKASGEEAHILSHSGQISGTELQKWIDSKLLRQRMAKTCGRVRFQGFAAIKPAMILEIPKVAERFEGKVWTSAVRHEIGDGNWTTDVQFGMPPEWHFEKHDLRPVPAAGLLPSISGLHIGVVTKIESDPDGEDRIQVRLPIISTQDEGIWARVSTLDAGSKRGSFFRPELNDEVVVGFLDDDPRHPVVLGMLHSSNKPAPHQPKDTNHLKGIVTRSNMKLWFDDEKKIATLETPAGNKLILSEDEKSCSLIDQHGNNLILDKDGIRIESVKDVVINAIGDITFSSVNMEAKASGSFSAEGVAGATLKASATAKLEGGAMAEVKGGLVMIN